MERKLKDSALGVREMVANNVAETAVAIASVLSWPEWPTPPVSVRRSSS